MESIRPTEMTFPPWNSVGSWSITSHRTDQELWNFLAFWQFAVLLNYNTSSFSVSWILSPSSSLPTHTHPHPNPSQTLSYSDIKWWFPFHQENDKRWVVKDGRYWKMIHNARLYLKTEMTRKCFCFIDSHHFKGWQVVVRKTSRTGLSIQPVVSMQATVDNELGTITIWLMYEILAFPKHSLKV